MADLQHLAQDWPTLSRRLDEALAIDAAQRNTWLDALAEPAAIKATLRKLLDDPALVETGNFADQLPQLTLSPAELGGELATAPTDAVSVGTMVGPYQLTRELGVGGMGQVWLAQRIDGALQRQVALKLPRVSWTRGLAERLARERDILASLDHPHIARIHDAGVDAQGRPYLALEYVEGEAIDVYCQTNRLTIQQRLQLILQVARAVAHAHARLVVHRDLKPANILVTAEGQVRLLDFGIAKLMEGELTRETALTRQVGHALTLDYASPEQIRGEPIGTASDVYSLGVVAYELLARAKPYQLKRQSAAELEEAIATVDVRLASSAATQLADAKALKGDLDAILNKALKKNVVERYATVEALALDIERHLNSMPVLARPDALGYRAAKFWHRNRLAVASSVAVSLALVSGAAVALWQASVAQQQARLASQQAVLAAKEARRAQAVQGFILDIFRANSDQQTDPQKARNATARELLDIGAVRLESSLQDAPEARVQVMETLGEMYYQLQLEEQAAAIDAKRIVLLKQLYGANDRRVAEALVGYAAALHATTRRDEILPALEEARRILDANGDLTSKLRGDLLTRLAQRYQNISLEKMKSYADEALTVLRSNSTTTENVMSPALALAARARMQLGENAAAEGLFRESLNELRKAKALPQVALAQGRTALAECLAAQQKFDAALREHRESAAGALASLGSADAATFFAHTRLATLLHGLGMREEARALHVDTLRRVLAAKGADDTLFTPMVRVDYARSLLAEGRLHESLELVAAVNASNRRHYAGSTVLGGTLRTEASVLSTLGHYSQGRQLFAEGLALWKSGSGGTAANPRGNRFHLDEARLDLALGEASIAITRLAHVVPPNVADALPLHADELERDVLLSQANLQLGAVAKALQLAQAAAQQMSASPVRTYFPALDAEVSLQLGQALLRAGRPGPAREAVSRALAWRRANDSANSPELANTEMVMARCHMALGETAQARAAVQRASTIFASNAEVAEHFKRPLRELQLALRVH
jgi:eukaryotic-like serine/threonine-protein kinase